MALLKPERNNYCIDNKNNIVWIRVPKVASTSIRNAWKHTIPRNQGIEAAQQAINCYVVMFVRNPLDRFISAWRLNLYRYPFTELVDRVIDIDPCQVDRHVRPQWTFAEGLRVDFTGHYETIADDWKLLQQRYSLNDLPHKNRSQRKPVDIDSATRRKLMEYYKKDYDLYYS